MTYLVALQMVQQGAVLAPNWTAAMFHELLDQETNPASAPALHHAAELMSLHDAAKTQHCMTAMQPTISGQTCNTLMQNQQAHV